MTHYSPWLDMHLRPELVQHAREPVRLDAELRQRMGRAGRELVENEFAEEHVVAQTLSVYRKLLDERQRAA